MDYTIGQVAFMAFYGLSSPDGDGQPLTWNDLDLVEMNKWDAVGVAAIDYIARRPHLITEHDAAKRAGGKKIVD